MADYDKTIKNNLKEALSVLINRDNQIDDLRQRLEKAEAIIEALLEPVDESCRLDHHGLCQSHWLHNGEDCPVKLAKEYLE
jgi:hypothetical protein